MRPSDIVDAVRMLRWLQDRPGTFTVRALARGLSLHMRTAYRYVHALSQAGVIEVVEPGRGEKPRLYRRRAE